MSFPPPPPPPPPPLVNDLYVNNVTINRPYFERRKQSKTEFLRELTRDLEFFLELTRNSEDTVVTICTVTPLQPILQNGPVCGLVALGMALEYYADSELNLDEIFDFAKSNGMSKSGEMFSTLNMKNLAIASLSHNPGQRTCKPELINTETPEAFTQIVSCLLDHDVILIPYDADHNHAPANCHGNAAHWAVIIGLALVLPRSDLPETQLDSLSHFQPSKSIIFIEKCTPAEKERFIQLTTLNPTKVYMLCRQGKSKRVGIWPYQNLILSNQNLKDVGNKIRKDSSQYLLLESIDSTLKSQAVLLGRNQF